MNIKYEKIKTNKKLKMVEKEFRINAYLLAIVIYLFTK
jgi:hypothetical protein